MRRSPFLLPVFLAFFLGAVPVRPADVPRIGVLDLTAENMPAAEARILTDRMRAELVNTGRFIVLERAQMEAILTEVGFSGSGCVATECAVEVGQLLGVEKMIAGTVGRFGEMYTLTARMIDVKTGVLEQTSIEDCRCPLEDLLSVTAVVVRKLGGLGSRPPPPPPTGETGILYIASNPPGARITLDNVLREEVTPTTLENIPVGEHVIRLAKESLVAEERITVLRDEITRVNPTLHVAKGSAYVNSNPPDADVAIDNVVVGRTPVIARDIDAGRHVVRVSKSDYLPWVGTTDVMTDARVTVPTVDLQPCGYLDFLVEPAEAEIVVDGLVAARTKDRVPIAVGPHRVLARHANHDSSLQTVQVNVGQTTAIRATLRPRFGEVSVTSTPTGASIASIPAGIRGTTPYRNDRVPVGTYTVRVTIPDRVAHEAVVAVYPGQAATVAANLPYAFGRVRVSSTPTGAQVSSAPAGISGATPYSSDRVEPGRYTVKVSMTGRVTYTRTVDVQNDATVTMVANLPESPEAIRARQSLQARRSFRALMFLTSAISGGVAYKFERDAKKAFAEADAAWNDYRSANTTADALVHRRASEDASARGNLAAKRRNVLYGVAGGAFGLMLILSID